MTITTTKRVFNLKIWGLALGYFVFYLPYMALVKATTSGVIPNQKEVSGFEMLPATVVATVVMMTIILAITGWSKNVRRRRLFGINLPFADKWTALSGLGTAVIIMTTTLAYSFKGIPIVLAIVMLRAGVLTIAPVVDLACRRRVRWFSWTALVCSLGALAIVALTHGHYDVTATAAITIGAYCAGYAIRLPCMTKTAKSGDVAVTRRYFAEEMIVAMATMIVATIVLALIGWGDLMIDLRRGFTGFMWSESAAPAYLAGLLYACLYFFGTQIYLDRRENTFCIPLNRGASVLSSIIASYGLVAIAGTPGPRVTELISAGLVFAALLFLSPLHHFRLQIRRVEDALSGDAMVERPAPAGHPHVHDQKRTPDA